MRSVAAKQAESIDEFMRLPSSGAMAQVGRVVIVSDSIPERNGVGAYYQDLQDQLEEQCDQIGFLGPDGKARILKFPLPGDPTQKIWIPSFGKFRRMMKDMQPECIIAATPGPYGLLGCWWARRLKVPFVVGFHTHFSGVTDQYSNRFLRAVSRFYFNIVDWIMFRYADLVLANSEAMVELACKLGARQAEVMGTLLPDGSLKKPVTPIGDPLRHVIFAGRLAPEKRVHWVIEAAEALPHIRFTLAGDGPLKAESEAAAGRLDNLECLGWVSRPELLEHMDRADLLVLPSVVESFGTAALEAMARGRLVIVTPTCGIVEWPDLADKIFQLNEGQTLAEAISAVAAMPAIQRRQIAAEAAAASRRFNAQSVQHWLSLLEKNDKTTTEAS